MSARTAIGLEALLFAALLVAPVAASWEIDATGVAYHVVDGDTIDVDTMGRVRLADIDAPELGQPGYQQARDFLNATVTDKDVFVDIDDVSEKDGYGRWVCVVYVRHNATHLLNVNEALLEAGVAVVSDYNNEFDPSTWTLYVYFPVGGTPPTGAQPSGLNLVESPWFIVALVGIAIVAAALATSARGRRRRRW